MTSFIYLAVAIQVKNAYLSSQCSQRAAASEQIEDTSNACLCATYMAYIFLCIF